MNTRLHQFLSAENLSQSQFADIIDVARASVSHIIAGRNKPGWDFLSSTMKHFPDLNIEWLMNGSGKMYKSQMKTEQNRQQNGASSNYQSNTSAASETARPNGGVQGAATPANALSNDVSAANNRYFEDSLFGTAPEVGGQSESPINNSFLRQDNAEQQPSSGTTPRESRIAPAVQPQQPDFKATQGQHTPSMPLQVIDNQRKISKIVIFYDDNTFIEIK